MYNPSSKKVFVSRDVIFEEMKSWDWGRNEADGLSTNSEMLTWEKEGDYVLEEEEFIQEEEVHEQEPETATETGAGEEVAADGEPVVVARVRREVRRPNYLQDYECDEAVSDEEARAYFIDDLMALQATSAIGDPTTFDEAVAYVYWREAMKAEI